MSNFLDKTEFSQEDIQAIIDSGTEESINIDFKDARSLSSGDGKEISKDVSAFANSDGGIIFYGINEENHVATSTSFVDGNKYNKEWLENKITSNIQQRIQDLLIIPVRFDDDVTKTIYVVKIPKSANSPHINGDNKYYRRFNFKSVPMEEYEVRDAYFRMGEGRLVIDSYLVKMDKEQLKYDLENYTFKIEVHIGNDGNFLVEKYKLSCIILNSKSVTISTNNKYNITHHDNDKYKISTIRPQPIFPNESLNVLDFTLEVPILHFDNFIQNTKFEFYLHGIGYLDSITDANINELMQEFVERII